MYKIIDNILVNFIDYDEGKPIVFLHDWGQNLESMDAIGRKLDDNRKILLDLPGFGDSEEPNRSYSLNDYADALRMLLIDLNIDNPIIVGHSFGGKVAIKYASKYNVEKLVLFSTAFKGVDQTLKTKIIKALKNDYVGIKNRKNVTSVMRDTYNNVYSENLIEDAKKVDAPTLLVCQKNDGVAPIETLELIESQMKNASLIELKESQNNYIENTNSIASILNKYFGGYKVKKRIK